MSGRSTSRDARACAPEGGGGLEEGRDYTLDARGRMVMTAEYLLRRGFCCGHGCRHCPYEEGEGGR